MSSEHCPILQYVTFREWNLEFHMWHGGKNALFLFKTLELFDRSSEPFWFWLLNKLTSWTNLEFRRRQMSCWGCPEGACKWIPRYFFPKMIHNFRFLMFPRFRRLYLTILVELRSYRFFCGSIVFKYFCIFQKDSLYISQFCPLLNNDWAHFS